ncbi:MAG: hypothetical protein ACM3SW_00550 [Actinomycetota bacterium]
MDLRKVYGGTPVGQDSKCDTCVYARIIRGYSESEKITICDRIFEPVRIPFPVRDCSDYLDRRLPCVEDLEDIAWVLRSKSAGNRAGFIGVTQAKDSREPDEDLENEPEEPPFEDPEDIPEEVPAAQRKG